MAAAFVVAVAANISAALYLNGINTKVARQQFMSGRMFSPRISDRVERATLFIRMFKFSAHDQALNRALALWRISALLAIGCIVAIGVSWAGHLPPD